MLMRPIRQKELSTAATTYWVMWLCPCQTVGCCLSVSPAFITRRELFCVKCVPIPVKKKKKQNDPSLLRVQKLMTHPLSAPAHPLSAPAHPPILFDQSLSDCLRPGGYSIYPWVGRCGPAPHTLTLSKTNIAGFPTVFKTEFRFFDTLFTTYSKSYGYKLCGFLVVLSMEI